MRVLELFSGTHSVGKIAKELGYEIVSLDLKGADINVDVLKWDYKIYRKDYFDMIWASPPCNTFSHLQIWRGDKTREQIQENIDKFGLPILRRTQDIIKYFEPELWFIENPQTGRMKEYMNDNYYDVDYCMYCDWGYRKRTRIWTNKINFNPKLCNKKCGNMVGNKHTITLGNSGTDKLNRNHRYRIPPNLIRELIIPQL